MSRSLALYIILIVMGMTATGWGIERFPPPDFESGYELPTTETPDVAGGIPWLDMAVLVGALSLASWLALKKRSRKGIFLLTIFSLLYFGFWRQGCICSIGAIQNVSMSLTDAGYTIPLVVVIFFVLPLLFTLFFGRTFCGGVCPLGMFQDIILWRPMNVPGWLAETLSYLGYIYLSLAILFAATGSAFIICQYDPFVAFFRLSGSLNMLIVGFCFLILGMFIGRPYCRFLCPYGVILRLFSRVSQWRVRITPAECIRCRLCEDSCPFGAIQKPTQAPTAHEYKRGKTTLILLLVLTPITLTVFGVLGRLAGPVLSRMHYQVRLADRIYLEESGTVEGTNDASEAYRASGQPLLALAGQSETIQSQYRTGTMIVGLFLGLVLALKLITLTIRRTRADYEADRGLCFACGRCYAYCPVGRKSET